MLAITTAIDLRFRHSPRSNGKKEEVKREIERKIGVAMNDGDVMMQNSSKLKEINKALMGNANRVKHQWVKESLSRVHIHSYNFHS